MYLTISWFWLLQHGPSLDMFHENLKLYASDYRLLIQVLNTFHHQTEILSMLMLVILLAFSVPPEKTEVKEWQHTGGGMNKAYLNSKDTCHSSAYLLFEDFGV